MIDSLSIARQTSGDYSVSLKAIAANLRAAGYKVLSQVPARSAVRLQGDRIFRSGDKVLVNGRVFTFGSVVSDAMAHGEDPVAAIDRAREHGHKLVWLSPDVVALHNGPTIDHQVLYQADVGDWVRFEGRLCTLEAARNQNLDLVPMSQT